MRRIGHTRNGTRDSLRFFAANRGTRAAKSFMNYQAVFHDKDIGFHLVEADDRETFTARMAIRDHVITGENRNKANRSELQGQPIFSGMCGPMWNGNGVRYESVEAYAILSS